MSDLSEKTDSLVMQTDSELQILKTAIENAPMSFVITDTEGKIEYVNPWFSKLTGYTLDEAIGQNPRILKSGLTSDEEYVALWDEITHQTVWRGTFKNLKKNGEPYWESATILPIKNEQEVITHYLGIKQEITQAVNLIQEVHDTQDIMIAQSRHAAMGEMIGMIAHQWRQPLSIIAMTINNMILDIELGNFDQNNCLSSGDNVMKQVNYLSKTIDDFRDFFRPDKGHESIKIIDVIEEGRSMIDASLKNNGITLTIQNDSNALLNTTSRELLQVFINILKNAKEALLINQIPDALITIHISDEEKWVVTHICDNGGGINTEIMGRIFEPYFSTKDEKIGTGLGLFMSKTIIEKHLKGMLDVQNSENGVCFSIRLPKE
jgi:PAS domain S-box-containing protein